MPPRPTLRPGKLSTWRKHVYFAGQDREEQRDTERNRLIINFPWAGRGQGSRRASGSPIFLHKEVAAKETS